MQVISLSERSNEIVNFIEDEVYIPDEIQKQLLEFITIVDTMGRIRGYNVFITPHNKDNIITGGARKRAAHALLDSQNEDYVGVYFQSQDGNYFYERIRI